MAKLLLDEVRKKKKVSIREFAKRMKMDYAAAFRLIKRSSNPTFRTLERVAKALEVRVRDLFKE